MPALSRGLVLLVGAVVLQASTALAAQCPSTVLSSQFYGDGYCDASTEFNTGTCGWDGGDCCRQTCVSTAATKCGDNGWQCLHPDYTNDASDFATFLDGTCSDRDGYCSIPTQHTCEFAATLLGLADISAGTPISNTAKVC